MTDPVAAGKRDFAETVMFESYEIAPELTCPQKIGSP